MVKKFLMGILITASIVGASAIGYFGYLAITDYVPEKVENLEIKDKTSRTIKLSDELTIGTSNIGFGGMDKDVHFFLDGGTMSRAISKERVHYNTDKVAEVLKENKVDIALIQEVDIDSTRSYRVNQFEEISKKLDGYDGTYGINFDVPWLLLPVLEPHGEVLASQAIFSNRNISKSERIALPIEEGFPNKLLSLDRMMLVTRMPVENGKELVVINVHLSAYDKGGVIRKLQTEIVGDYLKAERDKGNYVVLGGDFNQAIPGSDAKKFETQEEWPEWLVEMPKEFNPEGYTWAFDGQVSTCRNAGKEYIKGYNFLSIIDGFMVSDNIEIKNVKGIDTQFEYSDHNPVILKIKLK